jgi:hypothetical protein
MKYLVLSTCLALACFGADRKPLPNQAGNDDIDVFATVLLDHAEIDQAVGADIPDGFAAVRIRVVPKADQVLIIGPNDFTLVSRKDGERSPALDPAQITGKAGLIIKAAAEQPSRMSTVSNGTIWGGVRPTRSAPSERDRDSDKKETEIAPQPEGGARENTPEANPLLAALKAKGIPEDESKKPLEGLLYFPVQGKLKPKDLSMIYKSPNGRMVIDFK